MATRAHSGAATSSEGATVIGAGIRVSGRVDGEEDLHVEGRVEGQINLSETLVVSEGGIVVATVSARDVVVAGVVVGDVTASNCVTLHAGAKLVGDIAAPRLVVADGAAFRGNVLMGEAPPAAARAASSGAARRPSRAPARPRAAAGKTATKAAAKGASKAPAKGEGKSRRAELVSEGPARRVTPIRPSPREDDDEVTIVVRHAEVPTAPKEAAASGKDAKKAAKKTKAKKAPPRARMPKPGKRRITRR